MLKIFVWVSLLCCFIFPVNGAVDNYVYVASNAIQYQELSIFVAVAITNTTEYWFNPVIYFLDTDGKVLRKVAPLIKGRSTWQKASSDLVTEDFQGSVWIVSPHPLIATTFIYQLIDSDILILLGSSNLRRIKVDQE